MTVQPLNTIMFLRTNFRTDDELLETVAKQVALLLRNSYSVSAFKTLEDDNAYAIEYASMDPSVTGTPLFPAWLTVEEVMLLGKANELNDGAVPDGTEGGKGGKA